MEKHPIVSVTYENERISIKNSLPYTNCVLRLSCLVHGPIYDSFMGCTVNVFLSIAARVFGRRRVGLCTADEAPRRTRTRSLSQTGTQRWIAAEPSVITSVINISTCNYNLTGKA